MNIVIVVHSNDPETVWNAFRFANISLSYENQVSVFLLGKGVEASTASTLQFDVQEQMDVFREHNGRLIGCGVCCDIREEEMPSLANQMNCEIGSIQDLYILVAVADRVLTF